MKNIIMIVTCCIVGGAMAFVYSKFTKRLNQIEEDRWGKKKEIQPGSPVEAPKASKKSK